MCIVFTTKERLLTPHAEKQVFVADTVSVSEAAQPKTTSADIHNILRKTELRTVLRSKNRLFLVRKQMVRKVVRSESTPFYFAQKHFAQQKPIFFG